MSIPFYLIENSWCILEIIIKNNCYWIEWNVIYDNDNNEIRDKNKMTFDYTSHTNILCIIDNKYCYYNTDNKVIHEFNDYFNILSIDGSRSLETLSQLKNKYNEFLFKL
jgi:hypothetical protein